CRPGADELLVDGVTSTAIGRSRHAGDKKLVLARAPRCSLRRGGSRARPAMLSRAGRRGTAVGPSPFSCSRHRGRARSRSGALTALAASLARVGGILLAEAAGTLLTTLAASLARISGIRLTEAARTLLTTLLPLLARIRSIRLTEAARTLLTTLLPRLAGVGGVGLAEAAGALLAALLAGLARIRGVALTEAAGAGLTALLRLILGIVPVPELPGVVLVRHCGTPFVFAGRRTRPSHLLVTSTLEPPHRLRQRTDPSGRTVLRTS